MPAKDVHPADSRPSDRKLTTQTGWTDAMGVGHARRRAPVGALRWRVHVPCTGPVTPLASRARQPGRSGGPESGLVMPWKQLPPNDTYIIYQG